MANNEIGWNFPGNNYGREDKKGQSPTHREFLLATELGKTRLIFVKGEDDSHRQPKMLDLIRSAGEQLIRRRFTTQPELNAAVYASLVSHLLATGRIVTGPFDASTCRNATPNDMTLLPAVPAVNDAYYFGHSALWDWLRLNIGTAGVGVWTIVWEYWNGATWAGLPDISDGTSHFGNAGTHEVAFTRPGDWAVTNVGGIAGLYWIRARVSSYTSIVTQPLGTQAWIWVKH